MSRLAPVLTALAALSLSTSALAQSEAAVPITVTVYSDYV